MLKGKGPGLPSRGLLLFSKAQPTPPLHKLRGCRCRIDRALDLGNPVGGKAAHLGVLADQRRVLGQIDAVDLVLRDVRFHPLDVSAKLAEDGIRLFCRRAHLLALQGADGRHFTFNDKTLHGVDLLLWLFVRTCGQDLWSRRADKTCLQYLLTRRNGKSWWKTWVEDLAEEYNSRTF